MEAGRYERVYFLQNGSPNLTECLRPLFRRFEEESVNYAKGKIGRMRSYVIFLEGLPGSGKTHIRDQIIDELIDVYSERLKRHKGTKIDYRSILWERMEDELRSSGVIATRGMAPDSVEDLERVGQHMASKVAEPIKEGRSNLLILIEKPGGTSVVTDEQLIVSRPYAPTMRHDLMGGKGHFGGIPRNSVVVTSIGVVAGPRMEILAYYRNVLKLVSDKFRLGQMSEKKALIEADKLGGMFGLPEEKRIKRIEDLFVVQEGGSVETIRRAAIASSQLLDVARVISEIKYPAYFDRLFARRSLTRTRDNFFEDIPPSFKRLMEEVNEVTKIMDITTGDRARDYLEMVCRNLVTAAVLDVDFRGSDRGTIVMNNPDMKVQNITELRRFLMRYQLSGRAV